MNIGVSINHWNVNAGFHRPLKIIYGSHEASFETIDLLSVSQTPHSYKLKYKLYDTNSTV
jgi:hypothetical protein